VKLELKAASGETINAEMPHDRFRQLGINRGDRVFAAPRSTRLFQYGPGRTRTGAARRVRSALQHRLICLRRQRQRPALP